MLNAWRVIAPGLLSASEDITMSNIDLGIHWVDGIELVHHCNLDNDRECYKLKVLTCVRGYSENGRNLFVRQQ
jgi:hypothetical protein